MLAYPPDECTMEELESQKGMVNLMLVLCILMAGVIIGIYVFMKNRLNRIIKIHNFGVGTGDFMGKQEHLHLTSECGHDYLYHILSQQ